MSDAAKPRSFGLYGIADSGVAPDVPILDKVRAFLSAQVRTIQLRMKAEPARAVLEVARHAVSLCREVGAELILNDRADLALLAKASGVHVGAEDLPVAEVRKIVGSEMIIGATVRTLEEAQRAAGEGADYVGYGPIFGTKTKVLLVAPRGVEALGRVVLGCPIPVVAIGGIGRDNIEAVARTGASGAAVVSAVLASTDPVAAARELALLFSKASA